MASRFNIPAPASVKPGDDVPAEKGRRLKVAVCPAFGRGKDAEASAEADPLKRTPRKVLRCSRGRPYRKPTQVGGHQCAQARE
jgi:hypothetical protein